MSKFLSLSGNLTLRSQSLSFVDRDTGNSGKPQITLREPNEVWAPQRQMGTEPANRTQLLRRLKQEDRKFKPAWTTW